MIYGAKIVAPNGSSFIIPDSNPFVFYKKITYQMIGNAAGNNSYDTGIPIDTVAIICARYVEDDPYGIMLGGIQSGPNFKTNTWWIWASAYEQKVYNIEAYVFLDREYNAPDSVYGIAVYDEQGRMSLHANSNPLKLYEFPTSVSETYPKNMGEPVAVPCAMLSITKGGGLVGELDYVYEIAMANSLSLAMGFEGYLKDKNFTGFSLKKYLYIKCNDYN